MVQEYEEKLQVEPKLFSQPQMSDDGRYKTLFEQVNAAAFLTTLDGRILEANQKSCELFRYCWEDVLRLSLRDILPKEMDWTQFVDEVAARGGLHIETESVCKDGGYIPVEISISLFRMNQQPVMFVLIWDITDRRNVEKRLRESEKKYRGLFEYTTDGIIVLDARGDILDVNTMMCAMLDVSKDTLLNKNLFNLELLAAKSLPIVIRQFEQLLSEKTAKSYTTQITNRQGKILDVEISSFFLIKKENEVDNFVLIVRDSTAKNEADQKRAQEHDILRTLLEYIPDSVYFKDGKNRFVMVNKTKALHSNLSPEEMIGKSDFDFMPKDQAEKSFVDDTKILQSGQPIINKIEKLVYLDGHEKWISVTKIPRFNTEGEIIGTMGISRDVTTQELGKEELLLSEARYRAVFENSSFAIILTDENKQIISWNKLMEDLLGMGYEDLYHQPVELIYLPEEWEKIQAGYVKKDKANYRIETKIIRKDRRIVDADVSLSLLTNRDGKTLGSTMIIDDISKRKKTEEDLERHHELLTTLMDSIPDSIYFKDEQNRFVLVNKAKADRWKVNPLDMIGKTDFDFLPKEQAQQAFEDDNNVLRTGKPVIDKLEKITGLDGLERWFSVIKVPRYDKKGTIIGTIGISRDVTSWCKEKK